jgi:CheY-like chemotaxis protein
VAKILVADDNSNIQKMVGLALKDQGIDVVAVGNGEAAVRKISEIRPDLVLADVFMPVRNGYEVCEYVKKDPSLAHIPVILLVGAFDPLDEQEAQRVGADGVLKKPFVPPDPLISMVKSALARAGVAIAKESRDKVVSAAPKRASDLLPARSPAPAAAGQSQDILASMESESLVEEIPSKLPDLTIAAGDKTLAFGSLLETPGLTGDVDDSAFVTAKPVEFDTDRKWGSGKDEPEEEPEEEEAEATSTSPWRRDAAEESRQGEAAAAASRDWRTATFEEPASTLNAHESQVTSAIENSAGELAGVTPTTAAKPLPSFSGDAWAAAISAGTQEKIATEHQEQLSLGSVPAAPQIATQAAEEAPAPETQNPNKSNIWFSSVSSPWEADAQKASQLASGWDSPVLAAPAVTAQPAEAEAAPEETVSGNEAETWHGEVAPTLEQAGAALHLPSETVHALQEEVHAAVAGQQEEIPAQLHGTEETFLDAPSTLVQHRVEAEEPAFVHEALVAETSPEERKAVLPEPEAAKLPELDMEALVARVLARMSPEALQAVTREILKPVLETIIRDEINAKKP